MAKVQKNHSKALGIMNNQDSFLEDTLGEEEENNKSLNMDAQTMEKDVASGQKEPQVKEM